MSDKAQVKPGRAEEIERLRRKVKELSSLELELKGTIKRLQKSEELYKALVDTSPVAVTVVSLDGKITHVSEVTLKIHGFDSAEEILGMSAFDLIAPEDRERAYENANRTFKEGSVENVAYKMLKKDGSTFLAELNAGVVSDSDGNPYAFIAAVHDITQRAQMENALRASKERAEFLGSITERLMDAVVVMDADYKITYVNSAAEELFGFSLGELIGNGPEMLMAEPNVKEILKRIIQTARSGRTWEGTVLNLRKDGGTFVSELRVSPLLDEDGRVTYFVGVQRDITDRKRLEQELLQAQKMEAVGTMAGGIAHDFNNVLTAIIGYSELLLAGCEPGSIMRRDVEEIGKIARRAAALTRQLLSFSRRQVIQAAPIDLSTLIRGLDRMLRRLLGEGIEFVTELSPDLKRVEADAGRIEQVVVNLLMNSRDAMPESGRLTVRTRNVVLREESCRGKAEARPGGWVLLQVEDNGTGMDAGVMERIFEPFYTTKEIGRGSGLGLAVVFGIVKQHKGWIDVTSEPGKGATFSIYLPAISEVLETEAIEKVAQLDVKGNGERVLLVEDQDDVRALAARALASKGFVVFAAADATQALDAYEAQDGEIDVVFSDVVLPDRSGFELAEELRSRDPELPILFTSGYTDQRLQWSAIEERGYGFLEKPYELVELVRAVDNALNRRRRR